MRRDLRPGTLLDRGCETGMVEVVMRDENQLDLLEP
jgi:hypothetical protein